MKPLKCYTMQIFMKSHIQTNLTIVFLQVSITWLCKAFEIGLNFEGFVARLPSAPYISNRSFTNINHTYSDTTTVDVRNKQKKTMFQKSPTTRRVFCSWIKGINK